MAQQTYMFMIMKLLHYHKVIIYSVKKKKINQKKNINIQGINRS